MLCSSHFSFLIFGRFWQRSYENTKIFCNLCLLFARQDGQNEKIKKWKENQATKVTKIPKTKRQKYWMKPSIRDGVLRSGMLLYLHLKKI